MNFVDFASTTSDGGRSCVNTETVRGLKGPQLRSTAGGRQRPTLPGESNEKNPKLQVLEGQFPTPSPKPSALRDPPQEAPKPPNPEATNTITNTNPKRDTNIPSNTGFRAPASSDPNKVCTGRGPAARVPDHFSSRGPHGAAGARRGVVGFRVKGSGFRVQGLGFRVEG